MIRSIQPVSVNAIIAVFRVLILALLIAMTTVSVSFACNGGGGGGGGGGGSGGGHGDGSRRGQDRDRYGGGGPGIFGGGTGGGGGGVTISTTAPDGFVPAGQVVLPPFGGEVTFMGVRIPVDFPSGNCTDRVENNIRGIPEPVQSAAQGETVAERAQELENIVKWLRESPAGVDLVNNVRRSVTGLVGGAQTDDFRTVLAQAELNGLAQQIQANNDIIKQRNAILAALSAEEASPNPDQNLTYALQFSLHGSNAALATQQTRWAGAFAGARAAAQRTANLEREANKFGGELTVSIITNMVSGGVGSYVVRGAVQTAIKTKVKKFGTDVVVGGLLNYAEAESQKKKELNAGTKAVVTNTAASLAVTLVGQKLPLHSVVDATVAAATQTALDETQTAKDVAARIDSDLGVVQKREQTHNSNKQ